MERFKKWLLCKIFGHEYYVVQEFGSHTRRISCSRCKKDWGMNDRVKVMIDWNSYLSEMYFENFGYTEIKPWR